MESLYKGEFTLNSLDIGADLQAKPSALANCLQEAARLHAHGLGWGIETLQERQRYWVLSRTHVELVRRPAHSETLEVHTWPKGTHGLFALRDFEVFEGGQCVLKATSSWALLDAKSGRPTSVEDLSEAFTERRGIHAIETPADKVVLPNSYRDERVIQPMYTDLDVIGHVNNARYLDWAWSALQPNERKHVTGWTINYIKEVREADVLTLKTQYEENRVVCAGIRKDDKPAFVVAFHINQ